MSEEDFYIIIGKGIEALNQTDDILEELKKKKEIDYEIETISYKLKIVISKK